MQQADRPMEVPLDAKVALLMDARTYPEPPPSRIETVETHMSWVFLTDTRAYKLKKPVRYDFLDFSTLTARERNCREELRLNQALAPGVYLDVVPLAVDTTGAVRLERDGPVVEWLVKMRRLPADRMLDRLIRAGAVQRADVVRAAEWLAAFYRNSPAVACTGSAYRAQYRQMIEQNRQTLARPEYRLPAAPLAEVHESLVLVLERCADMFDRRAGDGRIVEGHGDLRPEHVCLEARPVVFDRLEFNRALRLVDPVEELCFLSMECARLGAPFVYDVLFDVYERTTGDAAPAELKRFYAAHRACIRARLAVLHTTDLPRAAWPKWVDAAREYLRLAQRYLRTE